MWLTISIANMLCLTALRLVQKVFVSRSHMNAFRINWLAFVVGLPVMLAIVATHLQAIEKLSLSFWLATVAIVVGYYPAANYLYFRVIRQNELSSVLPLFGLIPVFAVIFGWLLLHQTPSLLALGGILCVSASIYILQLRAGESWQEPLRALRSSEAARVMLVISVITAAANIGDKFAIQRSTTLIYVALNSGGAFLVLALCDLLLSRRRTPGHRQKPWRELTHLQADTFWLLITLGLLQLAVQVSSFAAVNVSHNTSYTIAIRNLNIVVASVVALLILRERVNHYKLLSYGLSAIGVMMIAL